jgi:type II secretory pathway predicted ATPase ExeA
LYQGHFGLRARPFGETVNPEGFVGLPSREAVLRRLRYGLEHGPGAALAFGPPGTGKTLLARCFARAWGGPCAHLTFPAMPAAELLALVAEDFGAAPGAQPVPPIGTSVKRMRGLAASAALRGQRPLLIVDDVHLVADASTFETLRMLLNFATTGPPDLALLLVGGPEVLLRVPPALADRLAARCLLGPLDHSESAAYLGGRLAAAGAAEGLFDPESITALCQVCEGLPRRLNRTADLALVIAYAQDLPRPDARCVAIAARELDLEPAAA